MLMLMNFVSDLLSPTPEVGNKKMDKVVALLGDVGGTNARLELRECCPKTRTSRVLKKHSYGSQQTHRFYEIVDDFLREYRGTKHWPIGAVIGFAGPITDNAIKVTTNVSHWDEINGTTIRELFNLEFCRLLNDFQANGYGIVTVKNSELIEINRGHLRKGAVKAVIGVGTGLGEAFLARPTYTDHYEVFPTEGGHTEFAALTDEHWEIYKYLKIANKKKRVSYEVAISGKFLPRVYEFFKEKYPDTERVMEASLEEGEKVTSREIFQWSERDELCAKAFEFFATIYGSETGNFALTTLCYGGIYLVGGVTVKNAERLQRTPHFLAGFKNKGRHTAEIKKIPVYAVNHEDLGLDGCMEYFFRLRTGLYKL